MGSLEQRTLASHLSGGWEVRDPVPGEQPLLIPTQPFPHHVLRGQKG